MTLGLVSGLVASQCATPALVAILTGVMSQDGALKQLRSLGRWSPLAERASGVVILGMGLYFLWIA